jgi:hypothetical protein
VTSNDLIEIRTRVLNLDTHRGSTPSVSQTKVDLANVSKIPVKGGKKPVPRRDHQAKIISMNKFLLIYGGKNDQAFQISTSNVLGS